jgi:hypothetical protein
MLSREDLSYLKLSAEARGCSITWGTRIGHLCQIVLAIAVLLAAARFVIDAVGLWGSLRAILFLLLFSAWMLVAFRFLVPPSIRLFQVVMSWFDHRSGQAESNTGPVRSLGMSALLWESLAFAAYLLLVALWVGLILLLTAAGVFLSSWPIWVASRYFN